MQDQPPRARYCLRRNALLLFAASIILVIPTIWMYSLVLYISRERYVHSLTTVYCGVINSTLVTPDCCATTLFYIDPDNSANLTYIDHFGNTPDTPPNQRFRQRDIEDYCDSLYAGLTGQCWLEPKVVGQPVKLLLGSPTAFVEGMYLAVTSIGLLLCCCVAAFCHREMRWRRMSQFERDVRRATTISLYATGGADLNARCKGLWTDAAEVAAKRLRGLIADGLVKKDDVLAAEPYVLLGLPGVVLLDAMCDQTLPSFGLKKSGTHSTSGTSASEDGTPAPVAPGQATEVLDLPVLALTSSCVITRGDLPVSGPGSNLPDLLVKLRAAVSEAAMSGTERRWLEETLISGGRGEDMNAGGASSEIGSIDLTTDDEEEEEEEEQVESVESGRSSRRSSKVSSKKKASAKLAKGSRAASRKPSSKRGDKGSLKDGKASRRSLKGSETRGTRTKTRKSPSKKAKLSKKAKTPSKKLSKKARARRGATDSESVDAPRSTTDPKKVRKDVLQVIAGLLQEITLGFHRLEGFNKAFRRATKSAISHSASTSASAAQEDV